MDNSASPLMAALEQSELGTSPAPYCGFDSNTRESVFAAGLQGANAEDADAIEQMILDTLRDVTKQGVPASTVEAMLHQFELAQREVAGGHYPYGLQIIMESIGTIIHHGDGAQVLDIDPHLARLKEKAQNPDFIPRLIREKLLDNPHRIRLLMQPDTTLADQESTDETNKITSLQASLTPDAAADIIRQTQALADRQAQEDDASILPKVTRQDVPTSTPFPTAIERHIGQHTATTYEAGTNGLFYQKAILPLPALSEAEREWLPLYCMIFGEVGTNSLSYLDVQEQLAADVGSIGMGLIVRPNIARNDQIEGFLSLSSKALVRKHSAAAQWMITLLEETNFTEHQRLREILQQVRASKINSIAGSGHSYAMGAASASLSALASQQLSWNGLLATKTYKALQEQLDDNTFIRSIADTLTSLHHKVKQQPLKLLTVAEAASLDEAAASQAELWAACSAISSLENPIHIDQAMLPKHTAWIANLQVNYVAVAYPAVGGDHEHAPALQVLAAYLRNTRLHMLIREQGGAYGGGASYSADTATFRYYSYRDPRIQGTIDDFLGTTEWMATHEHSEEALEEAILSVIGSIDKPSSPAGDAVGAFMGELFGSTAEQLQATRQAILAVTIEDLQQVARQYLQNDLAAIAVLGGENALANLGDEYSRYEL